jgi:hypothetical protein
LPIPAPMPNRFSEMLRLDLLIASQIADRSGDLKYPNKDLLYTTYEYPEFVPTVTIQWEALAAL